MGKTANAKAKSKLNENHKTFVKNRSGFHPAKGDLKEKAFLLAVSSEAHESETNHERIQTPYPDDATQTSRDVSFSRTIRDGAELIVYGTAGLVLKLIGKILPRTADEGGVNR